MRLALIDNARLPGAIVAAHLAELVTVDREVLGAALGAALASNANRIDTRERSAPAPITGRWPV